MRLSLPLDKVGCGSEEKISKLILFFSRLSLPLKNEKKHITQKYYAKENH